MQAKDTMSRDVVTVTPNDTILHAIRLMLQRKVSGLPVVDASGNLVGIVTEGDFLRRTETATVRRRPRWVEFLMGPGPLAAEYTRASGRFVAEVMTPDVVVATAEMELQEVVDLMERHHVKRLPVVSDKRLVGIVTRQDMLRALVGRSSTVAAETDDAAIRSHLVAALKASAWAPVIDVAVSNGRVTLTGAIFDDRQRDAVRVLAENIAGVKGIDDQLVWIEPTSGVVIGPPPHDERAA
jgi:CBS domain-containing protein